MRWKIYYTDREFAKEMGDPLLGIVEADTREEAEEAARKRGLPDTWAVLEDDLEEYGCDRRGIDGNLR